MCPGRCLFRVQVVSPSSSSAESLCSLCLEPRELGAMTVTRESMAGLLSVRGRAAWGGDGGQDGPGASLHPQAVSQILQRIQQAAFYAPCSSLLRQGSCGGGADSVLPD